MVSSDLLARRSVSPPRPQWSWPRRGFRT